MIRSTICRSRQRAALLLPAVLAASAGLSVAQPVITYKTENFNTDPGWIGLNNRNQSPPMQNVVQNFGYRSTNNAGGAGAGEIGGFITPTGEPAYYAKDLLSNLSFNSSFSASGRVKVDPGSGNTLLGFFNSNVVNQNEWRTPNSVTFRLYGRGGTFESNIEYGTAKWRVSAAGFSNGGSFSSALSYPWTLSYNPNGNGGLGQINASLGTATATLNLVPGHKADGGIVNRFGLLNIMKSYDGPGNVFLDDLTVNGVTHNFNTNPNFVGVGNVANFTTPNVRFRFDFGYSNTNHAGGAASGEIGGNFFRGDSRQSNTMAHYGGPLDQLLDLNLPLHAHGKVTFKRGVTDSTVLFGFFHSTDSVRVSPMQSNGMPENFMGVAIEGPSVEGFYFYPAYGIDAESQGSSGHGVNPPYIYPDDTTHNWSLDYDPSANSGLGRVTVVLDGHTNTMNLRPGEKASGAHFDRFGFVTTHIDGNGQTVFLDDITYTTSVVPGPSAWNTDAGGNWFSAGNWTGPTPNGVGETAVLGAIITAPRTVFADPPITLGTLKFDNNNTYVLAGTGSLTTQVNTGTALIDVVRGTHKINLPVNIASNTTANVAAGATLKFSDPVTIAAGKTLTQAGGGSVVYESLVTVQTGARFFLDASAESETLVLGPGSRTELLPRGTHDPRRLRIGSLQTAANAILDLNDNTASIESSSPQQIRGLINSHTIVSSVADSAWRLGYRPDDVAGTLIALTYAGDADLDGGVGMSDFAALAARFNLGDVWHEGDFNYDGAVNLGDFALLAANWQTSAGRPAGALAAVPEPAAGAAGVSLGLLLRRRRS